jgi:hypothetical protein
MLEAISGDADEFDFDRLDALFEFRFTAFAPGFVAWQSQQSSLTLA